MKLLLTVLVICGFVAIIPLATWAATGRLDRARQALREYLFVMALIVVPVLAVVGITLLPRLY